MAFQTGRAKSVNDAVIVGYAVEPISARRLLQSRIGQSTEQCPDRIDTRFRGQPDREDAAGAVSGHDGKNQWSTNRFTPEQAARPCAPAGGIRGRANTPARRGHEGGAKGARRSHVAPNLDAIFERGP